MTEPKIFRATQNACVPASEVLGHFDSEYFEIIGGLQSRGTTIYRVSPSDLTNLREVGIHELGDVVIKMSEEQKCLYCSGEWQGLSVGRRVDYDHTLTCATTTFAIPLALQSIAISLEKIANPLITITPSTDLISRAEIESELREQIARDIEAISDYEVIKARAGKTSFAPYEMTDIAKTARGK